MLGWMLKLPLQSPPLYLKVIWKGRSWHIVRIGGTVSQLWAPKGGVQEIDRSSTHASVGDGLGGGVSVVGAGVVGSGVGETEGLLVGDAEGDGVGFAEGEGVGKEDGLVVGWGVGLVDGGLDGDGDGGLLGEGVGAGVGGELGAGVGEELGEGLGNGVPTLMSKLMHSSSAQTAVVSSGAEAVTDEHAVYCIVVQSSTSIVSVVSNPSPGDNVSSPSEKPAERSFVSPIIVRSSSEINRSTSPVFVTT